MNKYISIDIGGTAIKYCLIDENANILKKASMATNVSSGDEILKRIFNIINEYLKENTIFGVSISTAGMVDTIKGEIISSSDLIPNYTGTKIKEYVEKNFNLPCEVENDVNCAGLAESISGAAKNSDVSLCLTIGTGIGGCVIIDGKIFSGHSFSAGEVGYMWMGDKSFESLAATSILSKNIANIKNSTPDIWNGIKIFEEIKKGDETCIGLVDNMIDILGKGIANICYVLNPKVIVLGGGIMAQEEYIKPRLKKSLNKYLISYIAKNTELKIAKYKNDAGMIGAFYNFMSKQN